MIICQTCDHERMMHDSWGCRAGCDCKVSIVFVTIRHFTVTRLDCEAVVGIDSREEDDLEELRRRSLFERRGPVTSYRTLL